MRTSLGVQTSSRQRQAPSGVTPSWFTRVEDFLRKEAELLELRLIPRPFDLDPCGHPEAPVSQLILRRGGTVWTKQDNGLGRSWAGKVVFENPPYNTPDLKAFGAKRLQELPHVAGMATLIPVWSDRDWWQRYIVPPLQRRAAELDFLPGRQRYGWPGNPLGVGGTQAMFPSCVVRWRVRR